MPRLRPWIARYGQYERADIEEIPIAEGQDFQALTFVAVSGNEVSEAGAAGDVYGLALSGTSDFYPFPDRALVAKKNGLWFAAATNRAPTQDDIGETAGISQDADGIWIVNLDEGGDILIKDIRDHEDVVEFEFVES